MIISPQKTRLAGFTLIEILIALVIFSIGLLGLAGMQLRGAEGTNTAYFRSQATLLANDMAERMHANRQGVTGDAYMDLDTGSVACDEGAPAPFCATRDETPGTICNAAQMATFDLYSIACGDIHRLPAGRLTVICNDPDGDLTDANGCSDGSPHTVSVFWSEVYNGAAETRSVTLTVLP